MLTHQFMAWQNLDRVRSKVVRFEDRLVGIVYGEGCGDGGQG